MRNQPNKKRLSTDLRIHKYFFAVVSLFLLYAAIELISSNSNQSTLIPVLIFLGVCGVAYYLLDRSRSVFYDSNFMFISNKNYDEKIPLSDIYEIRKTNSDLNGRRFWKIGYYDKSKYKKAVRIIPKWSREELNEFKTFVRAANHGADIQ